ncbi:MAG: radical SAM protein [Nitrospirae bacterium GWC2_57_13]|jgi:putative pyruvate formate lyase activating enzyme|nr:MAG: radical SAM protein [Nitrospirae bacterium GWC2_57_13]OGW41480.1 MAG: radical SAM protein [Nitrospirae bacterium GWD2_57_8]
MAIAITQKELAERIDSAYGLLEQCRICPRECGVNRQQDDRLGFCSSGLNAKVASVSPHFGEEPPLTGTKGSGTVFFANCSLRCLYCQNYPISQLGNGVERTPGELACQMIWLQEQGCHNLNLVTPTHFMPQILKALFVAREREFRLPVVWNSSGYESQESLRLLEGIVDIYLPDMRYSDDRYAMKYSLASKYAEVNRAAVKEMYRQVGDLVVDEDGIALHGLIVRHLVLPEDLSGTEDVMGFLSRRVSKKVHVSLMAQYFPSYRAAEHPELARKVTAKEFGEAHRIMERYGLENGWVQEHDG